MEMPEPESDLAEPGDASALDDGIDAAPPPGLGALGQLAAAILVVGVLILVFIASSAALRRLFG